MTVLQHGPLLDLLCRGGCNWVISGSAWLEFIVPFDGVDPWCQFSAIQLRCTGGWAPFRSARWPFLWSTTCRSCTPVLLILPSSEHIAECDKLRATNLIWCISAVHLHKTSYQSQQLLGWTLQSCCKALRTSDGPWKAMNISPEDAYWVLAFWWISIFYPFCFLCFRLRSLASSHDICCVVHYEFLKRPLPISMKFNPATLSSSWINNTVDFWLLRHLWDKPYHCEFPRAGPGLEDCCLFPPLEAGLFSLPAWQHQSHPNW